MLDQAQENALAQALRDADYASLTRQAATDSSNGLVDEVSRLITATEAETRKRKRGRSQQWSDSGVTARATRFRATPQPVPQAA